MADTTIDFSALETQAETATPESTQVTPETPTTESGEGSFQSESQSQEQPQAQNGRVNYRAAAKAAGEALPEQAQAFKEMADKAYRLNAHEAVFKTPADAQSARSLIETLGGSEGIGQIQERIASFDAQDEALRVGDANVLEALFKDFPEGVVQLAGPFMERIQKASPETFNSIVGPYAVDMLVQIGMADALRDAYNAQDPKQGIAKLYSWLQGQVQGRDQARNKPQVTQAKPAQSDNSIATREEKFFNDQISFHFNKLVESDVSSAVKGIVTQYHLNEGQAKHFYNALIDNVTKGLVGDQQFTQQDKIRKRAANGKPEAVASYRATEFRNRMKTAAPEIAKALWGAPPTSKGPGSNGNGQVRTTQQPQTTAVRSASGGPLMIGRRPDQSQIADYPGVELDIINGRAHLRDGRYVQWRR